MARGESDSVTAAVTLDRSTPPDRILQRPHVAVEHGIVVSCRVQAQLNVSRHEFEINEDDWVERALLTGDTARWSWHVTPKREGTHEIVLKLRPIMKMERRAGAAVDVADAADSNVQQYGTVVHVTVPRTERIQDTMSRIAATLNVAERLVESMAALLAATLALLAVLGVRHRRKRRTSP